MKTRSAPPVGMRIAMAFAVPAMILAATLSLPHRGDLVDDVSAAMQQSIGRGPTLMAFVFATSFYVWGMMLWVLLGSRLLFGVLPLTPRRMGGETSPHAVTAPQRG